mgnify:CR=1 FL=1
MTPLRRQTAVQRAFGRAHSQMDYTRGGTVRESERDVATGEPEVLVVVAIGRESVAEMIQKLEAP